MISGCGPKGQVSGRGGGVGGGVGHLRVSHAYVQRLVCDGWVATPKE